MICIGEESMAVHLRQKIIEKLSCPSDHYYED